MDVAGSVRLCYELKLYCVSRLCCYVGSNIVILPCFVLREAVAVKAQAGAVRKERKSSRLFLTYQRKVTSLNDAIVCLHQSHARVRSHAGVTVSESMSLVLADQTCALVSI